MLLISTMGDEDQLFYFLDGMQPWASQELQRRDVRDLGLAIAATECLIERRCSNHNDAPEAAKVSRRLDQGPITPNLKTRGGEDSKRSAPKALECFKCGGPHFTRECPKHKVSVVELQVEELKEEEETPRVGALRLVNALTHPTQKSNPRHELMYVEA